MQKNQLASLIFALSSLSVMADTPDTIDNYSPMFEVRSLTDGQEIFLGDYVVLDVRSYQDYLDSFEVRINDQLLTEFEQPPRNINFTYFAEGKPGTATLSFIAKSGERQQVQRFTVNLREAGSEPQPEGLPVAITSPQADAEYTLGQNILVQLEPASGTVELYLNYEPVATLTQAPYEYLITANQLGYNEIQAVSEGFNASVSVLVTEAPAGSLTVSSAIPATLDLPQGKPLTLQAKVDGPAERVLFKLNGDTLYEFTKPPYQLEWLPKSTGNYEFTIEAAVKDGVMTPYFHSLISVLTPDAYAFCHNLPAWEEGKGYPTQSIVRHQGNLFIANFFNFDEPVNDGFGGYSPWFQTSCSSVLAATSLQAFVDQVPGKLVEGQTVQIPVIVEPSAVSGVSVKEILLFKDDRQIDRLEGESRIFHYTYGGGLTENLIVRVVNNLGVTTEVPVFLQGNLKPEGTFSFSQDGRKVLMSIKHADYDGYVNTVQMFVDGRLVADLAGGFGWPGMMYLQTAEIELDAGTYPVEVKLTDNDGAVTTLTASMKVK